MKIILSAFSGKMESRVIDVPEETGLEFTMALPLNSSSMPGDPFKLPTIEEKTARIFRFRKSGRYRIYDKNKTAAEYILESIE